MEEAKPKQKVEINKTWILVAGLVILTAILLVISLSAKNSLPSPTGSKQVKTDFAHTSLVFSNEIRTSTTSGVYEVDVNIDSSDNKVTGVQLELSFDPKTLTKVDINPGSFIGNPQIIQKKVDTANGSIKLWLGIQPNKKAEAGKGTVAVITFSKSGNSPTAINFLPKTAVSAAGIDQSVLKNMTSGLIQNLPGVSLRPTSSASATPTVQQ